MNKIFEKYYKPLTFYDWKRKICKRFEDEKVKKVLSAELEAVKKNCMNQTTCDELAVLGNDGYTHIIASLNDDNNVVGEVEFIKDTAHDSKIAKMHGLESCIVVER